MLKRFFNWAAGQSTISDAGLYRWCQVEYKRDADLAFHLMKQGKDPWKYIRSVNK